MKVLSYNIREGGDARLGEIAGVILGQRPDAVALLEATSRANAETLARELGYGSRSARPTTASTSPG